MIRNLPAKWDLEADVVCVGSGIGGLSTAITAHDNGASVIVLERDVQIGGVTALSFGEVWVPGNHHAAALGINDSAESGFGYLKRLAMDYGEDWAMLNFAVNARVALKYFEDKAGVKMRVCRYTPDYYYGISNDAVAEGRMLEVEPFPAEKLGAWQKKTRISPHVPWGMSHDDIFDKHGFGAREEMGLQSHVGAPHQGNSLSWARPCRFFRQGGARSQNPHSHRRQRARADQ